VLVDDLITLGTKEPYRMFTSRAEYRLVLREDNADIRLTEAGREIGLVDDQRWAVFSEKRENIEKENQRLASTWVLPNTPEAERINPKLKNPLAREYSLLDLVKRPEVTYADAADLKGEPVTDDQQVAEQVEIQIKYEGYIARQQEEIERLRKNENTKLPEDFDYEGISGLSNEIKLKLQDVRPATLAQASRISGVTPAAISLLLVYLKKRDLVVKKSA